MVENAETGAREEILARYIVGCDGARSLVRETLGIAMQGNPVLTYTTNVIFRCPHLLSLHDKGKAYRHIFIGPEGTWATIVAINGRDEWRFSIIGGAEQRDYTTDDIKAAIRRAVGRDFEFEILSVLPWVRRELVAERYRGGRGFIAGDAGARHVADRRFWHEYRHPGRGRSVVEACRHRSKAGAAIACSIPTASNASRLERAMSPKRAAICAACCRFPLTPISSTTRRKARRPAKKSAANFPRPCAASGSRSAPISATATKTRRSAGPTAPRRRPTIREPMCRRRGPATARPMPSSPTAARPSICSGAVLRCSASARTAAEAAPLLEAARQRNLPLTFTAIAEPPIAALYERKFVLVRPDGHVAWRDDRMPEDALCVIDVVRGAADRGKMN